MNTIFRWTLRTSLVLLCGVGAVACSGDDDMNEITADDVNVASVKIAIAFEELDAAEAQAPAQAPYRLPCIGERCWNPLHKAKADARTEKEKGNALHEKPAGANDFSYADVTSIKLDVLDPATGKYFTKGTTFLQSSPGVWEVTLPFLPALNSLTFIAHAFDVDKNEIFTGSITQSVQSNNQIVTLPLAPSNDGATVDLPAIKKITIPIEFVSGQTNNIIFSIRGKAGDDINYAIDTLPDAGSFSPQSGGIKLYNIYGSFIAQYTPPPVQTETDFTHEITITNQGGNSVVTTFQTHVKKQGSTTGPGPTEFKVLFNPVINGLSAQRFVGTNDLLWNANVSDDGSQSDLSYLWTFAPDANYSPAPEFLDETINGAILTNYEQNVTGMLTLAVTDGDNGTTTIHTPIVLNQFPPLTPPMNMAGLNSIHAGGAHTCTMLANGTNRTVRCWGGGNDQQSVVNYGQLGYGNTIGIGDDEQPYTAGDIPLGGFGDVPAQLTTGGSHTCALLQSGFIRCWGKNNFGQLGYGDNTGTMANVGDAEALDLYGYVNVGSNAVKVVAGMNHTCALLDTGNVRCWGDGANGKLGYGNTNANGDNEQPYLAGDVDVGGPVKDLALGANHTCALLQNGKVRCWGYGAHGQLGYGNTQDIGDNEAPSSKGDVNVGGNVVQISAGYNHTCARLDTGFVRCWGMGNFGQLGSGNFNNFGNSMPLNFTDVNTGGPVVQVAAGGNHTCVILATGDVKCWGANSYGQLGNGQGNNGSVSTPPTSVVDLGGTSSMQNTTGAEHTCALLDSGNAWCWGRGTYGQLGYGNKNDIGYSNLPTAGGNINILTP
ncbi:MAG TPA: hypothetical protein PK156_25750 [Polyangium sp.]|nr:hypothetical protein [Polyangium sp.]